MQELNGKVSSFASVEIKLPSSTVVVSPKSLWLFMKAISQTGTVFTKNNLIDSGLISKSTDTIKRNLAYLKYLGIISEKREKLPGESNEASQKFSVIDKSDINDTIYELRANRESEALAHWHDFLLTHPLFKLLKDDFFKKSTNMTLVDFEHYLRVKCPNKSPQYYQNGGRFLMELFEKAHLISINGNHVSLNGQNEDAEDDQEKISEENTTNTNAPEPLSPIKSSDNSSGNYMVSIRGKAYNVAIELENEGKLGIVFAILEDIRNELKRNESM